MACIKAETDTPLAVDANTPLPVPVAAELFQTVVGRDAKIVDALSVVQHPQLAPRYHLNLIGQTAGELTLPNLACLVVVKTRNHGKILSRRESIVKMGVTLTIAMSLLLDVGAVAHR